MPFPVSSPVSSTAIAPSITAASPSVIFQDLLLVGGGHSHAIVLQMWAMNPLPGVRVTLISDRTHTPYSGMLPGHVAGFYEYDECHIDLRRLCEAAGAQFYLDSVVGLEIGRGAIGGEAIGLETREETQADSGHQKVLCQNHPPLSFDWLSLDIGSTPTAVNVPGARDYAIAAKPVPQFLAAWEHLIQKFQSPGEPASDSDFEVDFEGHSGRDGSAGAIRSLGIVGGGAGGVELAISMRAKLNPIASQLKIHLFQRGSELLPNHNPAIRRKFLKTLSQQDIQVHLNAAVTAIVPDSSPSALAIHHTGSEAITRCDRLFWVTNASAPAWIAQSGLATDAKGFILVSDTLQSISHPYILAAGDIATMVNHPRPKAGVFAVRQGKPLFENLRSLLQNQPPRPFTPQKHLLALIGTGDGRAVASRGRWCFGPSKLLWRWKDQIDRKFMARFSQLPMMGAAGASMMETSLVGTSTTAKSAISHLQPSLLDEALPAMYCSGCGAKVGQGSLERVLNQLRNDLEFRHSDPSILLGLDAPDDAAVLHIPANRYLVQTVDYFQSLVSDPYVFGQITANHCLNDIFAMGAIPHSALALAQISHGRDRAVETQLYQLLSGAMSVLQETQTTLIGGHTTEGDRLAFGLTCNGLADPEKLWKKAGMQPGQHLILTKALGTGTLFAAQAQGKAKGRWIDGAIASMVQSNAAAVEIFRQHHATACTDITGFGLLGHLAEMVQASGHCVALNLTILPCLEGAEATLEQGLVSSLHRQNIKAQHWVDPHPSDCAPLNFKHAILFDPQTSGGLLAAIPAQESNACVMALRSAGLAQTTAIGICQVCPENSSPSIGLLCC